MSSPHERRMVIFALALAATLVGTPRAQVEVGGNDVLLSGGTLPDGPAEDASTPQVAYNPVDDEYLVAFLKGWEEEWNDCRAFVQRVDGATGQPVGAAIPIGAFGTLDGGGNYCGFSQPAVAYNAQDHEYLVVWRSGDPPFIPETIKARRLDASTASPLAPAVVVADHSLFENPYQYDVAWNMVRNEYLVVWNTTEFLFNFLQGQRLDALGQEIGDNDFLIEDIVGFVAPPHVTVAHNPAHDEYMLAWHARQPVSFSKTVIYTRRLDGDGAPLGSDPSLIAADDGLDLEQPEVYLDALHDEYLVIFRGEHFMTGEHVIGGQRLDGATGAEVGPDDFLVAPAGSASSSGKWPPAASHDTVHDTWLVAWTSEPTPGEAEIFARSLSLSNGPLGPAVRLSDMGPDADATYAGARPAIAFSALHDEHFVVWRGDDDTGALADDEHEVFGQLVGEAECFLVIGPGGGEDTFHPGVHAWQTQVGAVEEFHPVLLDDIPEFVLPAPDGPFAGGHGRKSLPGWPEPSPLPAPTPDLSSSPDVPAWLADGVVAVQVVMWNPEVFPQQPEQSTPVLLVQLTPAGKVRTLTVGSGTGMQVWAEVDVDEQGRDVVRFPFSIPGL